MSKLVSLGTLRWIWNNCKYVFLKFQVLGFKTHIKCMLQWFLFCQHSEWSVRTSKAPLIRFIHLLSVFPGKIHFIHSGLWETSRQFWKTRLHNTHLTNGWIRTQGCKIKCSWSQRVATQTSVLRFSKLNLLSLQHSRIRQLSKWWFSVVNNTSFVTSFSSILIGSS